MPGRVLHVRPGLIVGPYDYSDRFTYWVRRVAGGGDVLAPGRPERRVQGDRRPRSGGVDRAHGRRPNARRLQRDRRRGWIDVRSYAGRLPHRQRQRRAFQMDGRADLLDRGVQPWSELPLWIPDADNGIFEVRNDKAIAKGLTFRPLEITVGIHSNGIGTARWMRR